MTIKELAKLADVSIATVSKIMNNKDENISPVTREKVLRIAQQHNYSPYAKAISKAFPKTQLVGVVVPDISDRLYASVVQYLDGYAMEQGYSLVVTSTFGDVNREALSIDSLLGKRVEYILFLYGRIEAASQDKLREHNTPFYCVPFGPDEQDEDKPVLDFQSAAEEAVSFLSGLGFEKMAAVLREKDGPLCRILHRSMERNKIVFDESLIFEFGEQEPSEVLEILAKTGVKAVSLLGIRADESLQRYSGFLNKKYGYKGECWISNQFKNVWCASPLYDWSAKDVWHANYLFSYDYNRLYDLYHKAGLKVSQMRVASPFNDYSKDAINLYRVIDPEIWCKLIGRVQGANFASIYGRTKAMGYRTITLPPGHTWKSYTHFLLDTLPKRLRNNYVKKFNTSIQFWHETGGGLDEKTIQELVENGYKIRRNGVSNYTVNKKSRIVFLGPIPDNTDNIKTTKDIPSWKRMCYCILKNDHICRFMGFGMTRQQQKRLDLIKKKYESIEDFNYELSKPGL